MAKRTKRGGGKIVGRQRWELAQQREREHRFLALYQHQRAAIVYAKPEPAPHRWGLAEVLVSERN